MERRIRERRPEPGGGEPLKLSDELAATWDIWHLWLEGKVNLTEFDRLSLDDVDLASEALREWHDAERRAMKKAEAASKAGR